MRDVPLTVVVVLALMAGGYFLFRESGGDDPFDRYCSEVQDRRAEIGLARGDGETTGLLRALPAFEALADKAPDDIKDEWEVVVARVSELRDALSAAEVDPAAYDPDRPPEGVDAARLKAIETAAVRLGSAETAAALTGVEQQARDVCKTPLSL
ncbi:hypothetical protein ASE01_19055 [Nocardioides sp. Root190]|nr:hypothetical protein ASE01_19055 [Nocardioides sp. Root190]